MEEIRMNTNRKKIVSAVLAAVLALSLAACGEGGTTGDKPLDTYPVVKEAEPDSGNAETTAAAAETTAPADDTAAPAETEEPDAPMPEEDPPVEEEIKSPELKEIGKIDGSAVRVYNNTCLFTGDSDETVECLNYMGEKLDGGDVPYVEKIKFTDVYSFCKKGTDIVYQGLMDAQGNVILGADQGVGCFAPLSERFVKAYFPEAETENKDEAIYYVASNQFSFKPQENDILYKGTVKVYDLETGKFLENTAAKFDPNYTAHGDMVSFYDADSNLVNVKADDTVVDKDREYNAVGDKFFIKYESDKNVVYDHDLKKLFSSGNYVYALDNCSYYYRVQDTESKKNGVMSAMGRTIIEPKYDNVYGLTDTYLTYSNNENNLYGLLKADGTELTKDEYKYFSEIAPGLFTTKTPDDKAVVIDKTGKVLFTETDNDKLYAFSGISPYVLRNGSEYDYFVYSTGEFSLELSSSVEYLGNYIINDYKNKALYNAVTGEKILDGFDKAYAAYGYIYVLTGDEMTVYEVV